MHSCLVSLDVLYSHMVVCCHVESNKVHQNIMTFANHYHLCRLGLIEFAAFYLYPFYRPLVSKA